MPVQRSLAIDYSFDRKIYDRDYENQYLFGPSLMIVPCFSTSMATKTYLPEGKWFDIYNDKLYNGNSEELLSSPLDKLPVLVKAGSIIPMQSPVQSTADRPIDTLILQVYGGADGSFVYYEDAGDSYNYQKGEYCKRSFILNSSKKELILDEQEGTYSSQFKYICIYFHGVDGISTGVKVNGTMQTTIDKPYDYIKLKNKKDLILKSVVLTNSNDKIDVSW
jgi:alpha-glucosidase